MANQRVDIKTGFQCNNFCRFCVQGDKRDRFKNKSFARIKRELTQARTSCNGVVLTGGEVTLRSDFLEIVKYAKRLAFETIQVQTNGRRFSYFDFCLQTIAAGANQFSPAVHGHTKSLHDTLTRSPGSFKQTVQGIRNLKKLDQEILVNVVVTKLNYRYLTHIARLLTRLKVNQFQFAFVHPIGRVSDYFQELVPRMKLIEPYIKKGLDIGMQHGTRVMTEAIPFCFMSGYEEYIAERFIPATKIYDANKIIQDYSESRKTQGKLKGPRCKACKYFNVCEGPWREYPEHFGWKEFHPVAP